MITTWLLEHVGAPALKFMAIFLAIASAIFGVRQWGKNAERAEQTQASLKAVIDRNTINSRDVSNSASDKWLRAPSSR